MRTYVYAVRIPVYLYTCIPVYLHTWVLRCDGMSCLHCGSLLISAGCHQQAVISGKDTLFGALQCAEDANKCANSIGISRMIPIGTIF